MQLAFQGSLVISGYGPLFYGKAHLQAFVKFEYLIFFVSAFYFSPLIPYPISPSHHPADSFLTNPIQPKQSERKEQTLGWGVYHLDQDEVNTRPESLCAYAGVPPKLVRLEPSEFALLGDAIITQVTTGPTLKLRP